ncbi:hypothetical protein ACHAQJ_009939 [Trichoderma viride]
MPPTIKSMLTQMFPPKPSFTEEDLPDLQGKVYIVTGSNTGAGKELARLLYSKNASIYLLARSEDKTNNAIADIRHAYPASNGDMAFLRLDLADLSTIKATVDRFLAAETKLHVLFNNAGVMSPEKNVSKTAQGHELHFGVNCLGTFVLTELLTPILVATARLEPPSTVRVIWVASSASEMFAKKDIGIEPEAFDRPEKRSSMERYGLSKVGNWAHGVEYARRHQAEGVVSVPLNPGNFDSDLYREHGTGMKILTKPMKYPPVKGAYTELFAGLSPEITIEKTGTWVIPFGRIYPIREDLNLATKTEAEGGTGGTLKFWEWTEAKVREYF